MSDKKFKKIYWLNNFNTWENLTIPSDKIKEGDLDRYNKNEYNIYETVNTFIWNKRQIKDLAEIKSCFIDIDYHEIIAKDFSEKERASYLKNKYNALTNVFKEIKDKFGIVPNVINITNKGFHILFHYSPECYFIDEKLHLKINEILNDMLWWDENARDLARVYKVVWFIDCKSKNKGKIKTLFTNDTSFITRNIIDLKFDFIYKERLKSKIEKSQKSLEDKLDKIKGNLEKINSMDANEFIDNLIIYYKWFLKKNDFSYYSEQDVCKILNKLKYKILIENTKYKLLNESLEETSWLFLEKNKDGIWKINDYSRKDRRGNYNFLKNWILKDKENFEETRKALYFVTNWIWLLSDPTKKVPMDMKLFWDKINNKVKLDIENLPIEYQDALREYTQDMLNSVNVETNVIFFALFLIIKEQDPTFDNKLLQYIYKIEWNELISKIWKSPKHQSEYKSNLIKQLTFCENFKIPFLVETDLWKAVEYKNIFKILYPTELKTGRWNTQKFIIIPTQNSNFSFSNKFAYFNWNILSSPIKPEAKTLLLKIDFCFMNPETNVFFLSFDSLFSLLNLKSTFQYINLKNAKLYIEKLKTEGFIKDFEFDKIKKTFKVFRYKSIKN